MTTLQIDYYYAEDRIPGAVKMVKTWFFLKTWKSWLTGENEVIHMSQILLLEDDVSLVDGLLDVTLPDGTGFDVCNKVRKQGNQIPIIFLTASDEEVNIIRGLDSGGDDYITKPFKLGELCSRIRALLRRAGTASTSSMIECGDISIDLYGSRVLLKGQPLDLTSAEYRLLCLLVRNANRTVTRDNIMNELWDNTSDFVDDNTLSVYVRRLREKIETIPSQPEHLITVRGFGYQWKEVSL